MAPRRAAIFVALAVAATVYYLVITRFAAPPCGTPPECRERAQIDAVIVAFTIFPLMFGLVFAALPLRRAGDVLALAAVACALLAAAFHVVDFGIPGNYAKFAAATLIGWWFLRYFEDVSWVVLIALIIPFVDAYSVWRGPTHHIVTHRKHVFAALSVAFTTPGNGAFALGIPDVLFYALFLAAAARWRLRLVWTWIGLTASLAATMLIAVSTHVAGLPALPLLSAGFLFPNVDLLWVRLRERRRARTG